MEQQQKRKWGRRLGIILTLLTVWQVAALAYPLIPSPWPPFYWALPIHGQVVDADTNSPLEGVIIAVHWELRAPWVGPVSQVAVMEAVTNKDGRYTIRWWRPRLRWNLGGLLESDAPGMLFFKSGYDWEVCANQTVRPTYNAFPISDCDGQIIELKKFQGSETKYAERVAYLGNEIEFAFEDYNCSWKKIPHMLVAIDRERKQLDAKGIHYALGNASSIEDRAGAANERWCGSIKKYLRSYMQ